MKKAPVPKCEEIDVDAMGEMFGIPNNYIEFALSNAPKEKPDRIRKPKSVKGIIKLIGQYWATENKSAHDYEKLGRILNAIDAAVTEILPKLTSFKQADDLWNELPDNSRVHIQAFRRRLDFLTTPEEFENWYHDTCEPYQSEIIRRAAHLFKKSSSQPMSIADEGEVLWDQSDDGRLDGSFNE